jgi:hypothetical protein
LLLEVVQADTQLLEEEVALVVLLQEQLNQLPKEINILL